MKRFLWVTPILFLLLTASAFADTVIGLIPNDGSGDNFGFNQQGSKGFIHVGGGLPFFFFHVGEYAPGSTLGGSTGIFFTDGFLLSPNGNSRDFVSSSGGTLFLSSFTLPTNGKEFKVRVEIDFTMSLIFADTGETLDVTGARVGSLTFHFFNGSYFADSRGFTVTPEPSTLGLMGTGLISILALARKRLRLERALSP
jgi:hypothetical protein